MTSNYRNSAGTDLDDVFYVNNSNAGALGFLCSNGQDLGNRYPSGSLGYNVGYKNSAGTDIGFLRCRMLAPNCTMSTWNNQDCAYVQSDYITDTDPEGWNTSYWAYSNFRVGVSFYFRFVDQNPIKQVNISGTYQTDCYIGVSGTGKIYYGDSAFYGEWLRNGGVTYNITRGAPQYSYNLATIYPNSNDFTIRIGTGMHTKDTWKNMMTNYGFYFTLINEVGQQSLSLTNQQVYFSGRANWKPHG